MVQENRQFIRKIHSTNDDVESLDRRVRKSDIWTFSTDVVGQGLSRPDCLVRTALSRSCPAGQTDNGQLFFENSGQNPDSGQTRDRQNPDRIAPPDSIFRRRTGFSTKNIIQLPTLNPYWQIRETKSKNLDIIKRYLRKQDFAETRFLSETS